MDGVMILQAIGDALMDEHNVAQVARPGTSLTRPATGAAAVSQNRLAGAAAHNMQALQSAIACTLGSGFSQLLGSTWRSSASAAHNSQLFLTDQHKT